jgi:hypothetical protein
VDRGRGREPDGVSDLAHRRRIAVVVDVLDEELQDLLLTCGEERGLEHRHLSSLGNERMFVRRG